MFDLVNSHWGSLPLHIAGLVTMLLELYDSSLYKMSRAEEIASLIAKAYWYSDPTTNIYDTTVVKEIMRKVKTSSSSLANRHIAQPLYLLVDNEASSHSVPSDPDTDSKLSTRSSDSCIVTSAQQTVALKMAGHATKCTIVVWNK